jgi:hypothetical protein
MPIREEMKALYPPNWHEISLAIRERAHKLKADGDLLESRP